MPYSAHKFHDWKSVFLTALAEVPVVVHACEAAGVHPTTAYEARRTHSDFAEAWATAVETGIDRAEREAWRRAVIGYDEPVIDKGRLAYVYDRHVNEDGEEAYKPRLDHNGQPVPLTVRRHSDALMSLILKGRRKSVYAERVEQTGADGAPLVPADVTARAARVAALVELARRRKESGSDEDDFSDIA